jgi:hypothetical protein
MTLTTKRGAHVQELLNRPADGLHETSKGDRISYISPVMSLYLLLPVGVARPLQWASVKVNENVCSHYNMCKLTLMRINIVVSSPSDASLSPL